MNQSKSHKRLTYKEIIEIIQNDEIDSSKEVDTPPVSNLYAQIVSLLMNSLQTQSGNNSISEKHNKAFSHGNFVPLRSTKSR